MVSEYKSTDHLGPEEWHAIFNLLTEHPKIERKDAVELLLKNPKIKRKDAVKLPQKWDPTTIGRALVVGKLIMARGNKPLDKEEAEQIAETAKYGTKASFVLNAHFGYIIWCDDYNKKRILKERHTDDLLDLAVKIRSCIERPNLDEEADYHQLLNVRGYDWRLDPVMWFYLCTPDVSKTDYWGTDPALLKSHIESNPLKKSLFWDHMDQLWQKVKTLDHEYDKMAIEIMADDSEFKKYWESIQLEKVKREEEGVYKPSRTPLSVTLVNDIRPYYDESKVDEVIDKFAKTDFTLSVHQYELEEILNQLYKDLNPNGINPLIVNGHCGECP